MKKRYCTTLDEKQQQLIQRILLSEDSLFENEQEVFRKAVIKGLKEFEKEMKNG